MAEFGIGKLIGVVLFYGLLGLSLLASALDPLTDPVFQEHIMIKYKSEIALFVISAFAIAAGAAKQWMKREVLYIQMELEKERLRSERLDNDIKEFRINKEKNQHLNDTSTDSDCDLLIQN